MTTKNGGLPRCPKRAPRCLTDRADRPRVLFVWHGVTLPPRVRRDGQDRRRTDADGVQRRHRAQRGRASTSTTRRRHRGSPGPARWREGRTGALRGLPQEGHERPRRGASRPLHRHCASAAGLLRGLGGRDLARGRDRTLAAALPGAEPDHPAAEADLAARLDAAAPLQRPGSDSGRRFWSSSWRRCGRPSRTRPSA